MSAKDSLNVELLSCRATTNLERFLRPSRKVTTKLLTSSVLLELKEYSSCLMVARVKAPPLRGQPFESSDRRAQAAALGHHQRNADPGPSHPSPSPHLLLETAVISGKESSSSTCSCSSTK